jgi:hypothetical protein
MSHWYTQDRLGQEHRADLDREAARAALVAEVRGKRHLTRRMGIPHVAFRLVALLRWRRPRTSEERAVRRPLELERDV